MDKHTRVREGRGAAKWAVHHAAGTRGLPITGPSEEGYNFLYIFLYAPSLIYALDVSAVGVPGRRRRRETSLGGMEVLMSYTRRLGALAMILITSRRGRIWRSCSTRARAGAQGRACQIDGHGIYC